MSPLFGPNPETILAEGAPVPGTLVGIEIKSTHDDDPVRYGEWAVEAGGTVYGIRQDLEPFGEIRLGMPVTLRVSGKNAVIEWRDSGVGRWKMIGSGPAAGIVDDHDPNGNRGGLSKARKGGRAATVTILGFSTRSVMGIASTIDARVRVDPATGEPYETTVPDITRVPGYAAHRPVEGARLPAWETRGLFGGEGIMIDWPAAAMAEPGVGAPNAQFLPAGGAGGVGGVVTGVGGIAIPGLVVDGGADGAAGGGPAADPGAPEIPQYAKDIMKKFGVDPEQLP